MQPFHALEFVGQIAPMARTSWTITREISPLAKFLELLTLLILYICVGCFDRSRIEGWLVWAFKIIFCGIRTCSCRFSQGNKLKFK